MEEKAIIEPIAHMSSHFPTKFGIPRQSGLANVPSTVIFTPKYRNPDALRGIEGFSHLWLVWQFSQALRENWSPTIRPPRLGGNQRVGVFASRSPFRPNGLGLSAVELVGIEETTDQGHVLHVLGADLMDGTPIFDIKPYLAYGDSYPHATGGYTDQVPRVTLQVNIPPHLLCQVPHSLQAPLTDLLAQDPRPSYQSDENRIYGMAFGGMDIQFQVHQTTLTVIHIQSTI